MKANSEHIPPFPWCSERKLSPHDGGELAALVKSFGAFAPPPEFMHPPEFLPDKPRPVPTEIKRGKYYKRRKYALIMAIFCAFLLITLHLTGISTDIHDFVNEGYVISGKGALLEAALFARSDITGIVILVITGLSVLLSSVTPKRYEYIKNGDPLAARILRIQLLPGRDPQNPTFGYVVDVEVKEPDQENTSFERCVLEVAGSMRALPKTQFLMKPGDYTTVVRHKDRFDFPLQLYGFLGLSPFGALYGKVN